MTDPALKLTNERRHVFSDLNGLDLVVVYDVDACTFRFTYADATATLSLVAARELATRVLIHLGRARDDLSEGSP